MLSKTELPGASEQGVKRSPLPSFGTLYIENKLGPSPLFTATLEFPGDGQEIYYNLCARINSTGEIEYRVRFELDDPEAENSVVRKINEKGSQITVSDEITRAEDPHISRINEHTLALGVVRTDFTDPNQPKKVTNYYEQIFPIRNGAVNENKSILCRPKEKDVRIAYLGNGKSIIVTRERIEKEIAKKEYEIIDSFIQALVIPSPKSLADIANLVNLVREDTSSRIDLTRKNKDIWVGPNFVFPLRSPNGIIPVGLFSHIGRYVRDKKSNSGETFRQYVTVASEHRFSAETGKIIASERAKIVSTASDFNRFNIPPKKEELNDVVFMGSPIFIWDSTPLPESVILLEGVNDRVSGLTVIKYPFSLPPDRFLNRDYIMSNEQARKYLHRIEEGAA